MHTHEGDRQLLQVLRQIGVDFTKVREINFYFIVPSQEAAGQAQGILQQKNIPSTVSELDVPWWKKLFAKPQFSLCATMHMALDESRIMQATTLFQQIATRVNGNYDGWEANVMGENLKMENFG